MKHRFTTITAALIVGSFIAAMTSLLSSCGGPQTHHTVARTPEQVAVAAVDSLAAGNIPAFVATFHPDLLATVDAAARRSLNEPPYDPSALPETTWTDSGTIKLIYTPQPPEKLVAWYMEVNGPDLRPVDGKPPLSLTPLGTTYENDTLAKVACSMDVNLGGVALDGIIDTIPMRLYKGEWRLVAWNGASRAIQRRLREKMLEEQ